MAAIAVVLDAAATIKRNDATNDEVGSRLPRSERADGHRWLSGFTARAAHPGLLTVVRRPSLVAKLVDAVARASRPTIASLDRGNKAGWERP